MISNNYEKLSSEVSIELSKLYPNGFVTFGNDFMLYSVSLRNKIFGILNINENIDIFTLETLPKEYNGSFLYIGRYAIGIEFHSKEIPTALQNLHNLSGPASICFDSHCLSVSWCINGNYHNPFGAARKVYNKGVKTMESYFVNNKLHNRIGPAIIRKLLNGNTFHEYYLNGVQRSKEDILSPINASFTKGNL